MNEPRNEPRKLTNEPRKFRRKIRKLSYVINRLYRHFLLTKIPTVDSVACFDRIAFFCSVAGFDYRRMMRLFCIAYKRHFQELVVSNLSLYVYFFGRPSPARIVHNDFGYYRFRYDVATN